MNKDIYFLPIVLMQFKSFYNIIYGWRNDNAHKAPKLPESDVNAAICMVIIIYLYATMVSITDLEAAGVL